MKVLPHKGPRSRAGRKRSTGRSAVPDRKRGAYHPDRNLELPKIAVSVPGNAWGGNRWAAAKIVLKRRCYRYLVWRDGVRKREFYLGKIKILAPREIRTAPAAADVAGTRALPGAGVQNGE